jgi:hypothetical protein
MRRFLRWLGVVGSATVAEIVDDRSSLKMRNFTCSCGRIGRLKLIGCREERVGMAGGDLYATVHVRRYSCRRCGKVWVDVYDAAGNPAVVDDFVVSG